MLITAPPRNEFASTSATGCDIQIRLLGGARDREIIPLAPGNHSIGSGPKCTLRLRDAGVGPMHCMIARTGEGVRVRRWSGDTLLNGQPFVESALVGGDYLSIGPIDLEIMAPTSFESVSPLPEATSTVQGVHESHELEVVELTEFDSDHTEAENELNVLPHVVESLFAGSETAEVAMDLDLSGIGFEILSALHSQREQFDALLNRVDELEKKVESALADADEPRLNVVSEYSSSAAENATDEDQFTSFRSSHGLDGDRPGRVDKQPAWTLERADLISHNADLEADLATAQRQLADAIAELGEAQTTIDELQSRLAASQRSCQELSEDQAAYQQQLTELDQQLATHAARAEVLQEQLRASQLSARGNTASTSEIDADFDAENSPAWPSTSVADEVSPVADNRPTVNEIWSSFEESASQTENRHGAYDWSTSSVDKIVESSETSSEECLEADDAWTTPNPWTFQESRGATSDKPKHETAEAGVGGEADPESRLIADSPAVESMPVADDMAVVKESDSHSSDEIDEALANLRELSLWRRMPGSTVDFVPDADEAETIAEETAIAGPEFDAPMVSLAGKTDVAVVEERVEEETSNLTAAEKSAAEPVAEIATPVADEPAAPATSSFIERYAHMFEADDRKDEVGSPAPNAGLKEIMQRRPDREAQGAASVAPTANSSEGHDADDSMEQYMARMMQRIRGDVASAPASKPASVTAPAENMPSWKSSGDKTSPATSGTANSAITADAETRAPAPEALISLKDLKRKEPTPEFSTDMGALRALANQTARHAIGIHTARTLRRNALTRFIVSLLAAVTSLYFMLNSEDWRSHEFSTGCVALIAAVYWGRLTFLSVIKAVKVGAFDDYGDDFTAIESAKQALPIDVERR